MSPDFCTVSLLYISHGVINYFPGLWGRGSSDTMFYNVVAILSMPVDNQAEQSGENDFKSVQKFLQF